MSIVNAIKLIALLIHHIRSEIIGGNNMRGVEIIPYYVLGRNHSLARPVIAHRLGRNAVPGIQIVLAFLTRERHREGCVGDQVFR